jgi:isocitrate dehydrogenase kinase/phosphatase
MAIFYNICIGDFLVDDIDIYKKGKKVYYKKVSCYIAECVFIKLIKNKMIEGEFDLSDVYVVNFYEIYSPKIIGDLILLEKSSIKLDLEKI